MGNIDIREFLQNLEKRGGKTKGGQYTDLVLGSLVSFVNSVVEIIEEIGVSIKESSSEVPKAKDQLEKITQETELAANNMLDIVEKILSNIESTNNNINRIRRGLKVFIDSKGNLIDFNSEKRYLKEIQTYIDEIQDYSYSLLNSLQFQDITAQQIRSANFILNSIRIQLNNLLSNLYNIEKKKEKIEKEDFDYKATIKNSTERQSLADNIVENIIKSSNIK